MKTLMLTRATEGNSWSHKVLPVLADSCVVVCLYLARLVFNDTFEMHDAEGKEIFLNESWISLDLKKYNKYNRQADSKDVQWINP